MNGENIFRFFISAERLLQIVSVSTRIHAAVTHKINWQGFPVLIIGATNSDRKLHLFGLAVCTDERQQDSEFVFKTISNGIEQIVESRFMPKILIADASDVIRNAFKTTFNNNTFAMYWGHIQRYVSKKLRNIENVGFRQEVLNDINKLQFCESGKIVNPASPLFVNVMSNFLSFYFWIKTLLISPR